MRAVICVAVAAVSVMLATRLHAEAPTASEEAIAVLGVTSGVPQNAGFVFVDGEYLTPPYTVTRRGDAIYVNRMLVEQTVTWAAVVAGVGKQPAKVAAGGVAGAGAVARDGDFDDIGEFDDIFGGDDFVEVGVQDDFVEVAPAPKKPAAERVVRSIDDLFGDDDGEVATPAVDAPQVAGAAAGERTKGSQGTTKELERVKEEFKARLEAQRKAIESGLEQGEIYLFSQKYGRINGTYGTARTLLNVLPNSMRYATSAQDLMQRLNSGGVYFLGANQCTELYQHRLRFPLLQSRLRRIEEQERIAAELRRRQ